MSDVTAGFFALGGAVVGGAATFVGTVYQQRRTAKISRKQKIHDAAMEAVGAVMVEFMEIQKVIRLAQMSGDEWHTTPGEPTDTWVLGAMWRTKGLRKKQKLDRFISLLDRHDKINIVMLRVTDEQLQRRIQLDLGMLYTLPPKESSRATFARMLGLCDDALRCLGAFSREHPLPTPSPEVMEARLDWEEYSGVKGVALHEAFGPDT